MLDRLLTGLHDACAAFPDKRKGAGGYSMADIGLSAFSLFFMQSEAFLSHQRSLEEGRKTSNCHTLFGMAKIPTDNHIRSMLDPLHPSHLQSSFDQVVAIPRAKGGMKAFERLGGRALIALDGTEYFCSRKLGRPHCQTRKRSNGKTEFYHSMLAATIVAPGHNMVVPRCPSSSPSKTAPRNRTASGAPPSAGSRRHAARVKEPRPVYLGDDLFACAAVPRRRAFERRRLPVHGQAGVAQDPV